MRNLASEPARTYTKDQQLQEKRTEPKRGNAGKFSKRTIQTIGERDGWLCVRCRSPHIETVPHHIVYKSQLGKGTADNGVTICRPCHNWAHSKREGREWFEQYQLKYLTKGDSA
jgi:5-methylcytosine-specific restriction endonuclease McrA